MSIGRLVVVPEFQGFGIGIKFMNLVADLYPTDRVRITTSLKPFMRALNKSKDWVCVRNGRVGQGGKTSLIHSNNEKSSVSHNRITATFQKRKEA